MSKSTAGLGDRESGIDEAWSDCPVCGGGGLVSECREDGDYEVPCPVCEKINALREALEFYANPENWDSPSSGFVLQYDPEPAPVEADAGDAARAALED